jgi:hypothetical protein
MTYGVVDGGGGLSVGVGRLGERNGTYPPSPFPDKSS